MDDLSMTRQIEHISIRSVAPISAAIFFILSCFTVASSYLLARSAPGRITSFELHGPIDLSFPGMPDLYILFLYPFLSAVVGAIGAAILAFLYNFLTRFLGPIRVRLSD